MFLFPQTFCVDVLHMGLGGIDSWGRKPLPEHMIRPDQEFDWLFQLIPCPTPSNRWLRQAGAFLKRFSRKVPGKHLQRTCRPAIAKARRTWTVIGDRDYISFSRVGMRAGPHPALVARDARCLLSRCTRQKLRLSLYLPQPVLVIIKSQDILSSSRAKGRQPPPGKLPATASRHVGFAEVYRVLGEPSPRCSGSPYIGIMEKRMETTILGRMEKKMETTIGFRVYQNPLRVRSWLSRIIITGSHAGL